MPLSEVHMGQLLQANAFSIRRLIPADQPLFETHLLRLDAESRRNRFGGAVSEAFLRDYAARAFTLDGVMFGYVEGGELRAAAELRVLTDDVEREAEAAFSVESDWRQRGLATALFERVIESARNRGIRRILVICLPNNRAMQALTRKFDGEIVRLAPDVLGVVEAPPSTWFTRWREAAEDAANFATAIFDLQRGLAGLAARRIAGAIEQPIRRREKPLRDKADLDAVR
jgi:ribosomal protein S18 acetylase RimI-like enzyme